MTSIPVVMEKGSTGRDLISPSVGAIKPGTDFSGILRKQSGEAEPPEAKDNAPKMQRTKVDVEKGGRIKEKDLSLTEKDTDGESETVEAAATLASVLMMQISEVLGMDVSQVQELMDSLGMDSMDLLQSGNLNLIVNSAIGETAPLELLTNETLYAGMQEMQATLQEGLAQIAELTGLSPEEVIRQLDEKMVSQETINLQQYPEAEAVEQEPPLQPDGQGKMRTAESSEEKNTYIPLEGQSEEGSAALVSAKNTEGHSDGSYREEGKGENHSRFSEGSLNPFMQNQEGIFGPGTPDQVSMSTHTTPDTTIIMDQIMDFMKTQFKEGMSQLEMQLHPESLGTLQIRLSAKDGVVTARFLAESEAVKAALENQMIQLKESFQEQGLKVAVIEVAVQSQAFERNMNQGKGSSEAKDTSSRRSRIRRLDLSGLTEPEDGFTEEEKLTAKLMEENGNTVDYTV